jgi:hypothetical protein
MMFLGSAICVGSVHNYFTLLGMELGEWIGSMLGAGHTPSKKKNLLRLCCVLSWNFVSRGGRSLQYWKEKNKRHFNTATVVVAINFLFFCLTTYKIDNSKIQKLLSSGLIGAALGSKMCKQATQPLCQINTVCFFAQTRTLKYYFWCAASVSSSLWSDLIWSDLIWSS